ncbi:Nn.00g065960.m01.CDS01 [Neocucurbitaria sp. VM-36]
MFSEIQKQLGPSLVEGASITNVAPSRWSDYGAPEPIAIVRVNSEDDVATTVKYCNSQDLPFLVRNGGNGWATFPRSRNLVMIDLSQLNSVVVAQDKQSAIIGGGAKISETIAAADAAGVLIMTGNCNVVSTLGALLAGGYGNTMGMFGFGVDNVLEMRVVTADGEMRTVSATKEQDLFWAMRGAGPNFGIVTSATMKAYATPEEERSAWSGALIFTEDKLEQVVQVIQDLKLSSRMVTFMYFASSGPPAHAPVVVVTLWMFQGTPETGKTAFKSLFDIGPVVDSTRVVPYTSWNEGGDPFCAHSKRKPSFGAGLNKLDTKAWREVWNRFVNFQKRPGAYESVILLETFAMNEIRFAGELSAAFPHRKMRFLAVVMAWYDDPSLDEEAVKFGSEVRELWRSSDGAERNVTYINFAHGDEPLEEIYGDNLAHLRGLKQQWDPENRFHQWFQI